MEALQDALVNLLVVVIGLVTAYVGKRGKEYLDQKGVLKALESKKEYTDILVRAMRETYEVGEGDKKFATAKSGLIEYLNANKISFTESELDSLIQSAVDGLKKGTAE